MVVGGEDGGCLHFLSQVIKNGFGKGHAIEGGSPPPDFVEEQERSWGRFAQGHIGFHHFHHEGRLTTRNIIRSPYPGENLIDNWQLGRLGWHKTTNLVENDAEGNLSHIGTLP